MPDPILIPLNEAATVIGRCRRSLYVLIAAGTIEAVKSGRSTLVVYDSLKQYAASLPTAKIKFDDRSKRYANARAV
jgi:excisionase family DNA binding protein